MHTIHLLEQALGLAQRLGYGIRQDWLDGSGGACEFGGRKWIFIDLALSVPEQFDQVVEVLREDPGLYDLDWPAELARFLGLRRSA
jgi:hypothetical protein